MKTSKKGMDFICSFEGLKLKPYLCSAGKATIGYGNTYYENGNSVKLTDPQITESRAKELFSLILPKYERIVIGKIKVPLTQNQFDALVSHTYNTGGSTTLFDLVNQNAPDAVIRNWFETKYIIGGGKVLKGLVRRRKAEADLFFSK